VTEGEESCDTASSLSFPGFPGPPGSPARSDDVIGPPIAQNRPDIVPAEPVASFQEIELDEEAEGRDLASDLLDQARHPSRRASGREHVVHDDHSLARANRVLVHLQPIRSVLQLVGDLDRLRGELPRFANRNLPFAESVGESGGEDESAAFDADQQIEIPLPQGLRHQIDGLPERLRAREKRRDVLEDDPLLRKVGYVTNDSTKLIHRNGPSSSNPKRRQPRVDLDAPGLDPLHPGGGGSPADALAELLEDRRIGLGENLDPPVLEVAHETTYVPSLGFSLGEPTKSHTLNPARNDENARAQLQRLREVGPKVGQPGTVAPESGEVQSPQFLANTAIIAGKQGRAV